MKTAYCGVYTTMWVHVPLGDGDEGGGGWQITLRFFLVVYLLKSWTLPRVHDKCAKWFSQLGPALYPPRHLHDKIFKAFQTLVQGLLRGSELIKAWYCIYQRSITQGILTSKVNHFLGLLTDKALAAYKVGFSLKNIQVIFWSQNYFCWVCKRWKKWNANFIIYAQFFFSLHRDHILYLLRRKYFNDKRVCKTL